MDTLPDGTLYYQALAFLVTLSFCAIFSFIETSITALRIFKLKELEKENLRYKFLFNILEKQPNKILFTIVIANSLAHASSTALITSLMQEIFLGLNLSEGLGLTVGVAIASCALVVFGEIIPKNIARAQGNRLLKYTLGITTLTYYLLKPFVLLITKFANLLMAPFGSHEVEVIPSEQELSFLIDYVNKKGIIDKHKTSMLLSIFNLSEKPIKEIIVPEPQIVSIEANKSIKDAINIFQKYQFTRFPVFENKQDNIVGIIYLKDIIYKDLDPETTITNFVRPIMFVPESMKSNQLLRQFKEDKRHMAIVLNEFGGIEGLVTLEDVLEQIVGPIVDEHENATEDIKHISKNQWLVNGNVNLSELKKVFNIDFETDSISLGGFITEQLQHLPTNGETLIYKDYKFKIENSTPKRILQVTITKESNKENI